MFDVCARIAYLRLENMYFIHESTLEILRNDY